jgi:hypothetical protein
MNEKYGYLRQDNDGHWYLIPENLIDEHDELNRKISEESYNSGLWDVNLEKYNNKFYESRIGSPGHLKVLIE